VRSCESYAAASMTRARLDVMSIVQVRHMSDDDLAAVIAFLRSQPAVENKTKSHPPAYFSGRHHERRGHVAEAPGAGHWPNYCPTCWSYGGIRRVPHWLQDCRGCHGADLTGGTPGQLPPSDRTCAWSKAGQRNNSSPPYARASTRASQLKDTMPCRPSAVGRCRAGRDARVFSQLAIISEALLQKHADENLLS